MGDGRPFARQTPVMVDVDDYGGERFLRQSEIVAVLEHRLRPGVWVSLQEIYALVEDAVGLTDADREPAAGGGDAPRWQRNVRNFLHAAKERGELEWDGAANYRRPPATSSAGGWELQPGELIRRKELHDRFGGSRQGGTIPSRTSPNVFLFLDRRVGESHGYYDGWVDDHLYYTGHGQQGDQELRAGNAAVVNHVEDGRAVRVFRGAGGEVTYLGEFALDRVQPLFWMEATEPATGQPRQVVVFRLLPVGPHVRAPEDELELRDTHSPGMLDRVVSQQLDHPVIRRVAVEQQNVEELEVSRTTDSYHVQRREQTLVLKYTEHLERAGSTVTRLRVQPPGEARAIVNDLYDETRNNLVEAKGSGTRGEVRMAIGQLTDYGRFVDPPPALAVLLPQRPRADLEQLLASTGIAAIWPANSGGFEDNAGGTFV